MSNQQVENKSNESTKDVSNANVVTNASSSQVSTLRPPVYQLKTADEKAEKSDVPQKDYAGSPPPENNTSKFKDVSVHTNSSKATELNAKAFTQGNNIHFAPGMFNENTTQGKQLISHELSHVIQQKTSQVKPTTSINGNPVNDDTDMDGTPNYLDDDDDGETDDDF